MGGTGLEPTTFAMSTKRSKQLSLPDPDPAVKKSINQGKRDRNLYVEAIK